MNVPGHRMSDASDEIQVDAPAEVEAPAEAPKGKLSVEDALQVRVYIGTVRSSVINYSSRCSKY